MCGFFKLLNIGACSNRQLMQIHLASLENGCGKGGVEWSVLLCLPTLVFLELKALAWCNDMLCHRCELISGQVYNLTFSAHEILIVNSLHCISQGLVSLEF